MRRHLLLLILFSLPLTTISCGKDEKTPQTPPSDSRPPGKFQLTSDAQKDAWQNRVIKKMWKGSRVSSEERAELSKLDVDAFIDRIVEDERFHSTVLDFNVFVLGFHSTSMKFPDGSIETSFGFNQPADSYHEFTPAVNSAQEFIKGGNYLSLFSMPQKVFLAPLQDERFGDETIEETRKQRDQVMADALQAIDSAMSKIAAEETLERKEICRSKGRATYGYVHYDMNFAGRLSSVFNRYIYTDGGSTLSTICSKFADPSEESPVPGEPAPEQEGEDSEDETDKPLTDDEKTVVAEIYPRIKEVILLAQSLDRRNYTIESVNQLKELDIKKFKINPSRLASMSNSWFWTTMTNSSTNMNRKRASYVLSRYFCDDLTPVNVQVPEAHAETVHGESPACYSCHYKLDPMAGYFRNHGIQGFTFEGADSITFDDLAKATFKEYTDQWKGENDAWDIGYVRSTTDWTKNHTAQGAAGVKELFDFIQTSDEPKRCLTKRAFEYFVSDQVLLEGSYHNKLSTEFIEDSKENSTAAFKNLVKKLAKSNSFVEPSPEKGMCYDYANEEDRDSSLPCKVRFLFKQHCTSCHSSTNNMGGLDITQWSDQSGFAHSSGKSKKDQLKEIEDRLMTTDPSRRMPLNMHIDSVDLQELYKWSVQEGLNNE